MSSLCLAACLFATRFRALRYTEKCSTTLINTSMTSGPRLWRMTYLMPHGPYIFPKKELRGPFVLRRNRFCSITALWRTFLRTRMVHGRLIKTYLWNFLCATNTLHYAVIRRKKNESVYANKFPQFISQEKKCYFMNEIRRIKGLILLLALPLSRQIHPLKSYLLRNIYI